MNIAWHKSIALGIAVIVVALVWAAFYVGSEIGDYRGERQHNIANYERFAGQEISEVCLSEPSEDIAQCIKGVVAATNEQMRAEINIGAQTSMATSAFLMFWVTCLMTAITSLGVFFVWRTLSETAAGVEAMRSEQRPWVFLKAELVGVGTNQYGGNKDFRFCIRRVYQNAGPTPAIKLGGKVGYGFSGEDREEFITDFSRIGIMSGDSGRIVPARGEFENTSCHSFRLGPQTCFFCVGITYCSPLGGGLMASAYEYRLRVLPKDGKHRSFEDLGDEPSLDDVELVEWTMLKAPT